MIKIFTDTDTDITLSEANELNLGLISMPYIVEGNPVYPFVDYKEYDYKTFYNILRKGVIPTTCALSAEEYKKYFEPVFANGDDILYIHFSSAMTATFDYMDRAIEELLEKYPERKFYKLDNMAITIGSNLMVKEFVKKFNEINDIDNFLKYANEEINHYTTYFYADDLKFFQRSGRVSGIAATMGTLLGIKPIIHIDSDGKMKNVSKEKGRKKALAHLINKVEEIGQDVKKHKIIIGHTDAIELAYELEGLLKEKLGDDLDIDFVIVNPTCGSHCGPNAVGISFYSKCR